MAKDETDRKAMTRLFEQSEINGMVLSNQFVRSATWEGLATDETLSNRLQT